MDASMSTSADSFMPPRRWRVSTSSGEPQEMCNGEIVDGLFSFFLALVQPA
jgi:hypothetical protein